MHEQNFGPRAELIRAMACGVALVRMARHGQTRHDAEFLSGCSGPIDPHHVRSRGAGGTARDLVPLCRIHHSMFHTFGRHTFDEKFGTDLRAISHAQVELVAGRVSAINGCVY